MRGVSEGGGSEEGEVGDGGEVGLEGGEGEEEVDWPGAVCVWGG